VVELARLGAEVWLVGRDEDRLAATREQAARVGNEALVHVAAVDVVDERAVRSLADQVRSSADRLDALVHGAGALFHDYRTSPDGIELTVATQVLAPFRLTWLLQPLLAAAERAVIVTVSSGGMYTQRFNLDRLELSPDRYRGATAYSRAKRAQVVLAHEWDRRWCPDGIASYAMHPGWVDTPGLAAGLPAFSRLRPLLRTPAQGADTAVWLAAGGIGDSNDGFWHDRHRRGECYLPTTYRTARQRVSDQARLWDWCVARTGLGGSFSTK
jgi:dehydrogenase/reductase SDR family protein 12